MLTNKHVKLFYGGTRKTDNKTPHKLCFKNFAGLNLIIKSNSKIFLKMIDREYKLFTYPKVIAYYKNKFKNLSNTCVEIFFENEDSYILSVGHAGLEREIKHFLFDRFIILHASSVRYNGFNLFFIGDVKSGKSTTCSAMLDKGAFIMGEDYSILNKSTEEALLFPTLIGNTRNGVRSSMQEKYLKRFSGDSAAPLSERIINMNKKDYGVLLKYHERLYGLDSDLSKLDIKRNKNVFICLKNDNDKDKRGILTREKSIEILPELMRNLASNKMHYGELIKEGVSLFLKSECYVLRRASLDLMVSEICSMFG
jgi:hypothetical protein